MFPPQLGGGWHVAYVWQCVGAHLLLPVLIPAIKIYISESIFTVKFGEYQFTGKQITFWKNFQEKQTIRKWEGEK